MGVVDDVHAYLGDQDLAGDGTDWALVRRNEHDETDQMVIVTEDGGPAPEIAESTGIGDSALEDRGVQVRARSAPNDGDSSFSKARAVYDALHGKRKLTMNGNEYFRIVALTAEPVAAGKDDNERWSHTISFRCSIFA